MYQSKNFDVQIAKTTIVMIQYLLVSMRYRMEYYVTIGVLFRDVKQNYVEFKLSERILTIILQIISVLESLIDNIDI